MHIGLKIVAAIVSVYLILSAPALAGDRYQTRVRVIEASKGPSHVDPGLETAIQEIRPVFQYTNFKLLQEKYMNLGAGQAGEMSLPGKRRFEIVPQGMSEGRIKYNININTKGKSVFRTGVMLRNDSSVTIGGPKVPRGVLLLDIHGRTR